MQNTKPSMIGSPAHFEKRHQWKKQDTQSGNRGAPFKGDGGQVNAWQKHMRTRVSLHGNMEKPRLCHHVSGTHQQQLEANNDEDCSHHGPGKLGCTSSFPGEACTVREEKVINLCLIQSFYLRSLASLTMARDQGSTLYIPAALSR